MVVASESVRERRPQHTIDVQPHEWRELRADAQAHGLGVARFILLLWRNWRTHRSSLALIPELPVEPWKRAG